MRATNGLRTGGVLGMRGIVALHAERFRMYLASLARQLDRDGVEGQARLRRHLLLPERLGVGLPEATLLVETRIVRTF